MRHRVGLDVDRTAARWVQPLNPAVLRRRIRASTSRKQDSCAQRRKMPSIFHALPLDGRCPVAVQNALVIITVDAFLATRARCRNYRQWQRRHPSQGFSSLAFSPLSVDSKSISPLKTNAQPTRQNRTCFYAHRLSVELRPPPLRRNREHASNKSVRSKSPETGSSMNSCPSHPLRYRRASFSSMNLTLVFLQPCSRSDSGTGGVDTIDRQPRGRLGHVGYRRDPHALSSLRLAHLIGKPTQIVDERGSTVCLIPIGDPIAHHDSGNQILSPSRHAQQIPRHTTEHSEPSYQR